MRIGSIIALPDGYTQFGRIKDQNGSAYTVDPGDIPKDASIGSEYAYKVELWSNDSGIAYGLREED